MNYVFERHPQGQTCRHCGQWKIEHHRHDGRHYCETPAEGQAPASAAYELTAAKISETINRTRWAITSPVCRAYVVTTYPNSELVYIETAASGRAIPQGVATKLTPAVRAAINAAELAERAGHHHPQRQHA